MFDKYGRIFQYRAGNHTLQVEWVQCQVKGKRAIVMREFNTTGPTLTNSMEFALGYLCRIFERDIVEGQTPMFFQDCGEEGVFRIDYKVDAKIRFTREVAYPEVSNVGWTYFCDTLKAFEALYGRT